jgi:DNA-binding Xre family transcriptional regulator
VNDIDELFDSKEFCETYLAENIRLQFIEEVCRVMEEKGINRKALVYKSGLSASNVKKMFKTQGSFKPENLARLAYGVGCRVIIILDDLENNIKK